MRSSAPKALLAAASVAVALAAADTYVVVLVLTDMMSGVGVGIDSLQKATPIISGFLLGYVAVLPLIGRISDLVSRQRVLVGCLAIFVLGSTVTALAVELPVLVTGRVVQGVGGGGLVPATLALVADLWPAGRRGTPLGVVGAVQELGSVLGPVLGAAVIAVASWRAIFWLNAGFGVLAAAAVLAVGRERPPRPAPLTTALGLAGLACLGLALWAPPALAQSVSLGAPFVPFGASTSRVLTPVGVTGLTLAVVGVALALRRHWPVLRRADLPGALLLGATLALVILTFASADPEKEVIGPLGLALLPAAAVTALLYVWRHRRAAEPLVARGVVRGRSLVALAVSLLAGVALVSVIVDVPLVARLVLSPDETVGALVLVRFLVAVPVGALAGGWLLRWLGDGLVASAGFALAALALVVMGSWSEASLHAWTSTAALVVAGLGLGLLLAPVNNTAMAEAPEDAHGTASALVVVARMVGMVVGLALLTAVGLHEYFGAVARLPDQTDTQALVGAALVQVHAVFHGAAAAALVGAVLSGGLGWRRRPVSGAARHTFGL